MMQILKSSSNADFAAVKSEARSVSVCLVMIDDAVVDGRAINGMVHH